MWTVDVVRGVLVAGFATAPPSASARLMTGQALAGAFLGAPAAGLLVSALIASLPRPARWRVDGDVVSRRRRGRQMNGGV